jgi:hypothetical protein
MPTANLNSATLIEPPTASPTPRPTGNASLLIDTLAEDHAGHSPASALRRADRLVLALVSAITAAFALAMV